MTPDSGRFIEDACVVMHDAYRQAAPGAKVKPWADLDDAERAATFAAVEALLVWVDGFTT